MKERWEIREERMKEKEMKEEEMSQGWRNEK